MAAFHFLNHLIVFYLVIQFTHSLFKMRSSEILLFEFRNMIFYSFAILLKGFVTASFIDPISLPYMFVVKDFIVHVLNFLNYFAVKSILKRSEYLGAPDKKLRILATSTSIFLTEYLVYHLLDVYVIAIKTEFKVEALYLNAAGILRYILSILKVYVVWEHLYSRRRNSTTYNSLITLSLVLYFGDTLFYRF
ncbi:hypothetical protein MHBO_000897 [Bonamia ostreae]|uniref:Uncharacterized protein n=1 Tax=Bonamia ostreae TaxID=126728 RepID=A0ABV2AHV6_9EUKA